MPPHEPRLLSTQQLAEAVGLSEWTIRKLVRERRIPYLRIGRSLRFDYAEVREATRRAPAPADVPAIERNTAPRGLQSSQRLPKASWGAPSTRRKA
jgi:excisionase family DNA binding protein